MKRVVLKRVLIFLILVFQFIAFASTQKTNELFASGLVKFNGEITNIFIHSLIAYPEILQTKSDAIIKMYDKDCIDYIEFGNMLNELYKNDFVLVDINKIFFVDEFGTAKKSELYLPKGKKPVVIGVDDVVYDPKKFGNGMVDKIALDKNDALCSITNIGGKDDIGYDREFVCILENFLAMHPDFSFEGSRLTINLTGFCGILGYRISDSDPTIRLNEIKKATKVVEKLKSLGYTFASHSYSHFHMKKATERDIERDIENWNKFIKPVIGETRVFVYPYGEWELSSGSNLSKKQQLLCDAGYKLFLGVGIYDFFTYMPLNKNISSKILFADRKNIDGYTLFQKTEELSKLFCVENIYSKYALSRHKV